jgi:hypothetical protein
MMQQVLVALIVACAFFAVARRYMPRALRQMLRRRIAHAASRLGWHGVARKLETAAPAAPSCADGCDTCGGCSSGDAPKERRSGITPEELKRTASR